MTKFLTLLEKISIHLISFTKERGNYMTRKEKKAVLQAFFKELFTKKNYQDKTETTIKEDKPSNA